MKTLSVLITLMLSSSSFANEVCNENNFEDYIYNPTKTRKLIKETGKGCDLRGIQLPSSSRFTGATFRAASLQGAKLRGINFRGSDFRRANLKGAILQSAVLRNTKYEKGQS